MKWLLSALILSLPVLSPACEKTLRWNDDPPFSMRRADGTIVGPAIEVNREILRRMGCSVRLLEMPWARALVELEAGRLDLLPGTVRTPERERFAWFASFGLRTNNALFVAVTPAVGPARYASLSDLRGSSFRLGVQIGVSYGPEFDLLMSDPAFARLVHRGASRRNLWLMTGAGRLDGVLANEVTAPLELAQLGLENRIRNSGLALPHPPSSMAFSKKSVPAEFVERFDRTVEAMKKDGSLARILAASVNQMAP